MCPPDLGRMQGAARPVAKTKRTDQLTDEVGRTKIPPDFVSFMSRGRERNEAKETELVKMRDIIFTGVCT